MKTTDYFGRKKEEHGVTLRHVEEALRNEIKREVQPEDGRVRVWGYVETFDKCVRVIFLPDGETVHNAFRDTPFTRKWRRS